MSGRRPRLRVIDGTRGPDSDPCVVGPQQPLFPIVQGARTLGNLHVWNREWTQGEHGGPWFTSETAHVDVVNSRPTQRPRIFAGGSRTFADRAVIDSKIKALPRTAIVLTSRTHGASAAIRDAVMRRGLQLEVWTAITDRHPTVEAAYFARDEEMIRSADRVLAFWDGKSSGTSHELAYAQKLAKPIDLVVVKRESSPNGFTGGDAA
jgi:hypothetical protein